MLRKSHIIILLIALPFVVMLAAFLIVGTQPPTLSEALDEYTAEGYLSDKDNQLIWNATQSFVQGTPFENKVLINTQSDPDAINIYILTEDPKEYFTNLQCNCAYLGQDNTIVCDARLIQYFRGLIQIPPGGFTDFVGEATDASITAQINSRFNFFLLQWIIGHEIGHLILDHGTGSQYFQPPATIPLLSRKESSAVPNTRQYEQAADLYVIEGLDPDRTDDQFWVWLGLSNLIGAMYNQTLNQQGINVDDDAIPSLQLVDNPNIHPPWLIRLLDMAGVLIDTYPAVVDESGYFESVRDSITLTPEGDSAPLLCEAETPDIEINLPEAASTSGDYALHVQNGFDYFRLTQYDLALNEFTTGINLMTALVEQGYLPPPQLLEAYLQRGVIYFIQGDYDQAAIDWEAAVELAPNDARASNNLGFVYYELDQIEEAITQWQSTVDIDPFIDDAWAGLGIAYYASGQTEQAVEAYQRALEIEPRYASLEWLRYERSWTEKSLEDAAAVLAILETS